MSDFSYDSNDQSTMRIAFNNYRRAEQTGFYAGLLFLPAAFLTHKKYAPFYIRGNVATTCSALLFSSIAYGLFTFRARNQYQDAASKMNRKYSMVLNRVINE